MGPAKRGHLEVVKLLLNRGADIEKINSVRGNEKEGIRELMTERLKRENEQRVHDLLSRLIFVFQKLAKRRISVEKKWKKRNCAIEREGEINIVIEGEGER